MENEFIIEESNPKKIKIVILVLFILLVIGCLVSFYIKRKYTFNIRKEVVIEVGSKVDTKLSTYIKSEIIDKNDYKLSFDGIKKDTEITKTGEYTYTIKYKNIKKSGKIIVEDTTAPEVETIDLFITKNDSYEADDFIAVCNDYSKPCTVEFMNESDAKITSNGAHKIDLVIKDEFDNKVTKTVNLTIGTEAQAEDKIRNDLTIHHVDPSYDDYNNTMILTYKKAMEDEDLFNDATFNELLEIVGSDLHRYIPEEYYNNLITESEVINVYNKYGYIIGFSIRVKLDNKNVFYITKEDYHE